MTPRSQENRAPQWAQNLAPGRNDWPQRGQVLAGCGAEAAATGWPQAAQNLAPARTGWPQRTHGALDATAGGADAPAGGG